MKKKQAMLLLDEVKKENTILKQQKESLNDHHQKQKARADHLQSQNTSLQNTCSHLRQVEVK